MNRRKKVELFEQIRREYEFGVGTIAGVAQQFGVHRRTVRQALESAVPPERKRAKRERPKLGSAQAFIDQILEADRKAPRKQRHTAHRIYVRLRQERADCLVAERTVRQYVRERKQQLGWLGREVCIPQVYAWGQEAQIDWYEATVILDGQAQVAQVFSMRSMASGGAFHRAYVRATQQAFFEAHELGFAYFGGVFRCCRYDNLSSAIKKVLRGHEREQQERFIAFRSHWQFAASFCTPAQGHEKGGVEGEVGYFRRNHWVPVPVATNFGELNEYLWQACQQDQQRMIGERVQSVGAGMLLEQSSLRPLASEGFDLAEQSWPTVDGKGCVQVRTNFYSTPLRPGTKARVRVLPGAIEVWHEGQCVARHERCYSRRQQILDLEHYLDVLAKKPGALEGAKPLEQWRRLGRWTSAYDQLWQSLQQRHGRPAGTRIMIELLQLGRQHGYERLTEVIEQALKLGVSDAAAVRYLLTAPALTTTSLPLYIEDLGRLARYQSPRPEVRHYDDLLRQEVAQ